MSPSAAEMGRIFHQPWWFDALVPGGWDAVAIDDAGSISAYLPYTRRRRLGMVALGYPPLTPHLGPAITPGEGKPLSILARRRTLLGRLLDALPRHDVFDQRLQPGDIDAFPWCERGATTSLAQTYRVPLGIPVDKRWELLENTTRTAVRKARETVAVAELADPEEFWRLHLGTFSRQGLKPPYGREAFLRLDRALAERGRRRILAAHPAGGTTPVAAIYLVWDEQAVCYLMSAGDPREAPAGAHALLLWTSIEAPPAAAPVFDFCGSMIPGVERFVRGFGGDQTPVLQVRLRSRRARILEHARDLGRCLRPC